MCTVSYIPNKKTGGFVLTSNRDEKAYRPTVPPKIYKVGETNIGFPKDEKAGGSWIAANNRGRLCCLLNGAFEAHVKKSVYAQSRGNILVEAALSPKNPEQYFAEKNLEDVEPFTIITVEENADIVTHFSEFVWDGTHKYYRQLNPDENYIWSSATLYSKEHRTLRRQWFNKFISEMNGSISPESILGFHAGKHTEDHSINLVMERDGGLETVSITQVLPVNGKLEMQYFDLNNQQNTKLEI
ncbi:MAG: NRDE family protein [Prolixibacteraceae bacterium]|nr:NRDE family protein [Prolixibacteraceae bacterium]